MKDLENNTPFKLNDIKEVQEFSNRLDLYMKKVTGSTLTYIDLPKFFQYCLSNKENGGRIFTAVLDLKITFVMLYKDIFCTGATESGFKFSKENAIKCGEEEFIRKCEMQYYYSNFIYRFRAFFDKYMGLLFLIYKPEEYNNYRHAKSRKKYFKDNFKNISQVDNSLSDTLISVP